MIIEISVAVIALAFTALVFYLIAFIRSSQVTLGQVNQTLSDARKQIDQLSGEAKKVIEHANQMSTDLQTKMETLDPIFNAVEDLGNLLENKTNSLKEKLKSPTTKETVEPLASKQELPIKKDLAKAIADTVELIGLGYGLWQNLKKRR